MRHTTLLLALLVALPLLATTPYLPFETEELAYSADRAHSSRYRTLSWSGDAASFALPQPWLAGRVYLHVSAAATDADIQVNGRALAYEPGQDCADITYFLVKGQNRISLHTTAADWQEDTYLFCRPAKYIEDYSVTTTLDRSMDISVRTHNADGMTISMMVMSTDGKILHEKRIFLKDNRIQYSVSLPELQLWSPDSPNRYHLLISLENQVGDVTECVRHTLIFRPEPAATLPAVRLTDGNTYAPSRRRMLRDLSVLFAANIRAVYAPAVVDRYWLDLCDQHGICVLRTAAPAGTHLLSELTDVNGRESAVGQLLRCTHCPISGTLDDKHTTLSIRNTSSATIPVLVRWQMADDGKTIAEGEKSLTLRGEAQKITIPTKSAVGERMLTVRYCTTEGTPLLPAGHELGHQQFYLDGTYHFTPAEQFSTNLFVDPDNGLLSINGAEFRPSFRFVDGSATPELWRKAKFRCVGLTKKGKTTIYSLEVVSGSKVLGEMSLRYTLLKHGFTIESDLTPTDPTALPRFGMMVRLPQDYYRIAYYGRGPLPCTPGEDAATLVGLYTADIDAERGQHTDVSMLSLTPRQLPTLQTGKPKRGEEDDSVDEVWPILTVTSADGAFSFSAQHQCVDGSVAQGVELHIDAPLSGRTNHYHQSFTITY